MVLGASVKMFVLFVGSSLWILLCSQSHAQQQALVASPVQNYEAFNKRLELRDNSGKCEVAVSSSKDPAKTTSLTTQVPWPCWFHTEPTGSVRTVVQKKTATFVLIESAVRKNSIDCDTHLQSLRFSGGKVHLSENRSIVASCPPFQWDHYMFTELFKRPKPPK
jgi:hypothetical protein